MSYDRNLLPDPTTYFEDRGHKLSGPARAKWKTTNCTFHGGSDSMRVNTATGAWVCMSCDAKGGDVLAFEMQHAGLDFVAAAKAVGAWIDDGKPPPSTKPPALQPRAALSVLAFESLFTAVCAGNLAQGIQLTEDERMRLMLAAGRIQAITGSYA
ncbi:MAG: CHC2 zinc finger domain-containing protein [Hydrogenophaga sp.]|uniref:CHC2 zinc finger domain-containing protein n=1 Tax=Hydrogenophaga sp. TaxID=1904254 RepID=UPI0027621924|nr:CHC2 zinc finger domain-containing protein [Hydrogenophaga sp.]MDP2416198.1 CHC2 zinc finger domain-containing protein [Hydrogenophaga sp.]MDZ4186610.1 CHC2 zinc finger domain-containing protein [Hydrogenophaga sp.]